VTSRDSLPPKAAEYLATLPDSYGTGVQRLVERFHAWLEADAGDLGQPNTELIDVFMQRSWAQQLADSTKREYSRLLRQYVNRLGGHDHARQTPALPKAAQQFIQELQATLRPETCRTYESKLRCWYRWAESQQIETRALTRQDVVAYCRMMYNRELTPATRVGRLVVLRRYLYYLDERKLLAEPPAVLVRRADFPKQPQLLPRALRADIDAELCARLAAAADIRCRGLLLMRHTGMRVGELATLSLDCVREDNQGHHYLKVPLGKLNTERLVPLNDDALGLVQALQEHGQSDREWLIENRSTRRPYTTTSYRNSISRVSSDLEKPDGLSITTHRLRHTFSTELLNAGLNLAAVRQLLGHRSMNMTLRYVSLTPNRLRQDYLAANAKARERYGKVPAAPRAAQLDDERTSAEAIADIVRQIKRDAAELSKEQKARARRAVRQLKNLGILLDELGL
jgi:site-specific recombinase XerD